MGNSASNPSRPPHSSISPNPNGGRNTTSPGTRQSSSSPTPGNPHRSMRTKKRSLELPDLASLTLTASATNTRGRQVKIPQSAAMPIAIPTAAGGTRNPFSHYSEAQGISSEEGRRRRPKNYFESTTSVPGLANTQSGEGTESREGSRGPDGDEQRIEEEYEEVVPMEPSTHIPFPPPSREQQMRDREMREQSQHGSSSRSRHHARTTHQHRHQTPAQEAARQAQVSRIQELYDRSQDPHPSAPPSSPASVSQSLIGNAAPPGSTPTASGSATVSSRAREIVRSSIPIALGQRDALSASGTLPAGATPGTTSSGAPATTTAATIPLGTIQEHSDLDLAAQEEDLEQEPAPVLITWRGGGTDVLLARAGDDEWKGRQVMEREHPNSIIFRATVYLRPGSHHIRFLVDGQWRVADDLPAAVDDQGSLANYVTVGDSTPVINQPPTIALPAAAPPMTGTTRRMVPGQSFWSAKSEGGDEDGYESVDGHGGRSGQQSGQQGGGTGNQAGQAAYIQARWTSVLPLELIEAAREEEAYLTASAGQYEANAHASAAAHANNRVVVNGFVPAPNIPPAPGLPRHLDKLILNSRVAASSGSGGSAAGERAGTPNSSGGGHGVGSGQGGAGRRERERRDRDRGDRERERERGERERGERDRERERDRDRERDRERDRGERERERDRGTARSRRANIPPPPPPSEDGSGSNEMDIENTYVPMNKTNAHAAAGYGSGQHTTESSASSTGGGTSTALTTPHVSVPPTPTAPLSPTQSPPKVSYIEGAAGGSGVLTGASPAPAPPSSAAPTQPPTPSSSLTPTGSRAITIDTANMPSLTDDASVLAVPSHVVLQHLCTSAIKNGVLAVASTTRYKKKYLTTIYYKPT